MNLFEIVNKEGDPYWERDEDQKVYIVYNPDGTEYSRHPYKSQFAVNDAYTAAVKDVQQIKLKARMDKHLADKAASDARLAAKPLNNTEQQYYDADKVLKQYFKKSKLGQATKADEEAATEASKVLDRIYSSGGGIVIRKSVLDGTYVPPK